MDHIDFRTSSTFMHSTYSLSLSHSLLYFSSSLLLCISCFLSFFFFFGVHNRTSDLSLSLDKEWFDSFFSSISFQHSSVLIPHSFTLSLSLYFFPHSPISSFDLRIKWRFGSLFWNLYLFMYSLYNSLFGFRSLKGRMLSKRNLRHFGL